jgi:hypothetical protein
MATIVWLTEFSESVNMGTTISDKALIEKGRELGHEITVLSELAIRPIINADLCVLSAFPQLNAKAMDIISQIPYVNVVRHMGFWGQNVRQFPDLLKKAKLNVFSSPLQKDKFWDSRCKAECMPDYIGNTFKITNTERSGDIVYVGDLLQEDGFKRVIEFAHQNPDRRIDIYSQDKQGTDIYMRLVPGNVQFKQAIPYEGMPEVLNQYKNFIYLPVQAKSFCRSVAEAYLCGCSLMINELVGCFSYDWAKNRDEFRKNVTEARNMFWNRVTGTVVSSIII